ncbi:hypothetical protein WA1_22765 [Scytonema hofmannii PCC 7110]|uniref:Uncharacterized protein n=1 Tax=Scytonema hofmannii PCC 7110 TaxID=128403 RepID=A0A139X8W1_9CYAN|nr:hypothetical protein [Scytonema hofmannii]KYC41116.1 hypothetical protein WA1_22765 [Scytonema hofmannii PCC 7110]
MNSVLQLIEEKKQNFSQNPLFEFMRDKSINPMKRLAWAPYAAPFIMNFGELNKYVFRQEPTTDPIQKIINKHTYEDDHHWLWFLQDLQKLGFDQQHGFVDTLKFLWGEETKASRWLTHQLCHYALQADPIQKLIVVEVTEATGNVMFSVAAKLGQEIKSMTEHECLYFADFHLTVETGHTIGLSGCEEFITDIQLTEETRQKLFGIVEEVFTVFTTFTNELLMYAKSSENQQLLKSA